MSKIKLLNIALIGLLVINLALLTFIFLRKAPQSPDGKPPLSSGGPKEMIVKELHFDKDQVSQYEKLIEVHRKSVNLYDDSISITKNELYESLENENTSSKDSLISRIADLQKKIEIIHYDHFADIRRICKPDQLVYYNELISKLADFFNMKKKLPPPPKDNK